MTQYLFPLAPQPTLPIVDQQDLLPVHRIFCVGRNYVAHALEMGNTVDREAPWYFTKSAHHVHWGGDVNIPPGTENYHHEIELVVALGSGGAQIPHANALDHVFGYAVGLDMTRRDLQVIAKSHARPWDTAKDVQNSAIIGTITPVDQHSPSPDDQIVLSVNGTQRQNGMISDMVWSVAEIISHLSTLYTLQAGDIIMTGTPAGVGPVVDGDRIDATITGLADLQVTFHK